MVVPESLRRPERFPPSRVSVKGQTVIPRAIRRLFNIEPGSRLQWEVRGQAILVYPVSQDPVGSAQGILGGRGLALADYLEARRHTRP